MPTQEQIVTFAQDLDQPLDWHPADIVASLRKRGTSLRKLSIENGFSPGSLATSMRRSWPNAEQIIAGAIGLDPKEIWPSRYGPRAYRSHARGAP